MRPSVPGTEELLRAAGGGDEAAVQVLLAMHRDKLRKMVDIRLDPRLARRIDASDVVQEALADAGAKLPEYLRHRPLPFLSWLRRLTMERIARVYRQHVRAANRAVGREAIDPLPLPDESAVQLVDRLIDREANPSQALIREERRQRVAAALQELSPNDREVLILRHLEHLSFTEVAEALDLGLGAVKMRHLRALQRLRELLDDWTEDGRR